jgi:hypothetical protein
MKGARKMKRFSLRKLGVFILGIAVLVPVAARSQQLAARRAQFAGTWRLDVKQSLMGSDHPSADYALTRIFTLNGTALVKKDHEINIEIVGMEIPERISTTEIVPDGAEHSAQGPGFLPGMPPMTVKITALWQGDNLVINQISAGFGGESLALSRYFLSEDGNLLTEIVLANTGFGDTDQKLVFVREFRGQ